MGKFAVTLLAVLCFLHAQDSSNAKLFRTPRQNQRQNFGRSVQFQRQQPQQRFRSSFGQQLSRTGRQDDLALLGQEPELFQDQPQQQQVQQPQVQQQQFQQPQAQQQQFQQPQAQQQQFQQQQSFQEEDSGDITDSIPGTPGQDYALYSTVPQTSFSCDGQLPGYYADPDAQCQVFHICQHNGAIDSFLCPNGTVFNQQYFVCDWWYNYDCGQATSQYGLNADLFKIPEQSNQQQQFQQQQQQPQPQQPQQQQRQQRRFF